MAVTLVATPIYVLTRVNYTEPMFVVVIMALASTRPVLRFAERAAAASPRSAAHAAAWWLVILTIGPLLGSFITEPAAMTICALLLAPAILRSQPEPQLRYATLGLLFVNVSIGGTLTHFAAPPVLMVAALGLGHAVHAHALRLARGRSRSSSRPGLLPGFSAASSQALATRTDADEQPDEERPPDPVRVDHSMHLAFLGWTVFTAHYPALFVGGFLFFLAFTGPPAPPESAQLRAPLLVGFFLGGLVIHGGLQGWWIGPLLGRLQRNAAVLWARWS